ncbi:hypothetical protein P4H66_06235 [Paenibacillus dokdonensis]|uniref:Coil containing protein n=1 Tax=Paenibacillus dokdonensis TaxID=2567944 RepID=A0ABU6GJS3_9BACL|nr:hypothetical protein [Paenibacillus dokdonensis]MEC0239453.1 hypothetical protein [Paenibacillus dokdonensis]
MEEKQNQRFSKGDFAYKGKPSDNSIVIIDGTFFSESLGYRYSIGYTGVDRVKGEIRTTGGSAWWNEDDFTPVSDPQLLLMIKKYQIENEIRHHKQSLSVLEANLSKVTYALQIINPTQPETEAAVK